MNSIGLSLTKKSKVAVIPLASTSNFTIESPSDILLEKYNEIQASRAKTESDAPPMTSNPSRTKDGAPPMNF